MGCLMVGTAMLQGEWSREVHEYVKQAYDNQQPDSLSDIAKTVLMS